MTSVLGHLFEVEFDAAYKNWNATPPVALFDAPISEFVSPKLKPVAENITTQARYCQTLFIWTDCDREGEHIGSEIVRAARESKPNIEIKRARFSNTERA